MDSWLRFNETPLPEKKELYRNLVMRVTLNTDYKHANSGKNLKCKTYMIVIRKQVHNEIWVFLKVSTTSVLE